MYLKLLKVIILHFQTENIVQLNNTNKFTSEANYTRVVMKLTVHTL